VTALTLALFWASAGLLAWVYFGYPALAWAVGRIRPVRLRADEPMPRRVTVGLAVHEGAHEIEERLANIVAQDLDAELEIVVASDGSTDDTVRLVEQLASRDVRIRLLELPRSGQSAAQSAIVEAASGEVVVLTDAETRFEAGLLRMLVAPFQDRRVGCVTGVLAWHYDRDTDTSRHEGLYWRYEQAVRRWESRAGWLSSATGALLAFRRAIYEPVPAHASLDQMLPLVARARGMLVLVVPEARGSDRGTSSTADQFRSRVRIATQGIAANMRMARRLAPWRRPGQALAVWSHKILRWMTPWLVMAAALAALLLVAGGLAAYAVALGAIGLVFLAALAGLALRRTGRPMALVTFPLTVVLVNACFALAWLNLLLRRRFGAW
jgi:cellulose synthase/poly-beta-1,6-N-acetylglucosamine synthase-like glycosyltransferase